MAESRNWIGCTKFIAHRRWTIRRPAQGKTMTEVLVVRHAKAASEDLPNAEKPLSEQGRDDARELATILASLGINAIYSSPFRRALETVAPLCEATGLEVMIRSDLRESEKEEELFEVRKRMVSAVAEIARDNEGSRIVVCTHGGTTWGLISHFCSDFGYEQYKEIDTPDVRRFVYEEDGESYDGKFRIWDL
jgi:2,3-bisphosphoglycerate-dependent phosphoglycerate mutase